MIFEIAELYETLSHVFGNHSDPTAFFKKLFHPQDAPALLRDRLARMPAPFSSELPALVDALYRKIETAVVGSVWFKSKVTPTEVMVRSKDLTKEEPLSHAAFTAEVMRVYRNAHHGYFTAADKKHNRPSRYLFLVDGNLPVELTALPGLWWLAYLADPGLVGWMPLPIQGFDT